MNFYAHSLEGRPKDEWEPLFTSFGNGADQCGGRECEKCGNLDPYHGHLNKVAWWTAKFAAEMFPPGFARDSVREWGYLAGLWHDLGKFNPDWQAYLQSKSDVHSDESTGKVDHATPGAKHAVKAFSTIGHLLAFSIAGHHSGLLDAISVHACMEKRLKKAEVDLSSVPAALMERGQPALPGFIAKDLNSFSLSFFTRMLFSCLVDADFLATEAFMDPSQSGLRGGNPETVLPCMLKLLETKINEFGTPATRVERSRTEVYRHCVAAASMVPGLFSLNVPTGGGKTLSSLAFALHHALKHGHRRIVYVIPFTSIIEQNAAVFRDIFAPLSDRSPAPVILEHHSNLSPDVETTRSRLASENWDAPLIVTTAVQFYESLYAARTSSCRKLHNIGNSVVILDEAQCLPVDLLKPCLEALRQLSAGYGTSIVFCTATQPGIHHRGEFPIGLRNIRPIIPDPGKLARTLERVKVVDRGTMNDALLALEINEARQVLAIVNTRRHARELFKRLQGGEEKFHLSASMCPKHRSVTFDVVRSRLAAGLPVRLISTQLIEAGVDVDFPLVYRSLAGLDSIAQAAGRCNRNGRLPCGETHVFRSEHQQAETYFRETAQVANQVLELYDNPLALEAVKHYFNLYYLAHNPPDAPKWDCKDVGGDFRLDRGSRELPMLFQFKSTSEKFRLIENEQVTVIVPFDEKAKRLVSELRNETIPLNRNLLRALQRYTVQIHKSEYLKNRSQFEHLRNDEFHVLICPEIHYSENFGLSFENENDTVLVC